MKYYKIAEDGKITDVVDTTDAEWAKRGGYINDRDVVQVYGGSFKFVDDTKEEDFQPPLSVAKENKIIDLKSVRNTKEVEPIQTDKGIFDYDDKSRDRLAIARQALTDAGGTRTIIWTTADNQRIEMTVADFASINAAAAARSNELHITYNELKDRVNSCATVDEVNAIVWEG